MSGGCLEQVCLEGCLEGGVQRVSKGCPKGVQRVSGGCSNSVWEGVYLEGGGGVPKGGVSGKMVCLEGVCLEGVYLKDFPGRG